MRALACVLLCALSLIAQEPPPAATATPEDDFQKALFFGKKFADLGEYTSAYEQLAKADALKPDQPAVLYNMAVVLARAGRYGEAQVKADRYLQLFPNGAEKQFVTRLQLDLEFQRELQKKRQADQEYSDLFNRAKFVYGKGELDEARKLFEKAEQLRPTDPAAAFNHAVVLEKQGEFARAIERYRRYAELEPDVERKAAVDERVFTLQRELDDQRTKIVCSFCGHKLPHGTTWCHRCWHGPYLVKSPVWNTRSCVAGAGAVRQTFFADARFNKNEDLPCLLKEATMLETLRYTAAKQRAIQDARRAEGWTYSGDVLQNWSDRSGNQIRYVQGPNYLEKITSTIGGEVLSYAAHDAGNGVWLLDREDLIVDAQRYTNAYWYDGANRIARQEAAYQNTAACNHFIAMTADYSYTGDALASVDVKGGYTGFPAEGTPEVKWGATIAYSYDEAMRLAKEELTVNMLTKTYERRPHGELRRDIEALYEPRFRAGKDRPIQNMQVSGDLCGTAGAARLANLIDLRPFYVVSPNLAMALQNGVTRAVVTFTYPDAPSR
jgi:tetratricopeptide (TPR) repeat protein